MKTFITQTCVLAASLHYANANQLEQISQPTPVLTLSQTEVFQYNEPVKTELAQQTTVVTSGTKDDDPYGIGSFILGLILIPFSLALLWKNEKKIVTYAKVIAEARKECKVLKGDVPLDENDYELVHLSGTTENPDSLTDQSFGATVENSYRLVRSVEMYQWKENVSTRERNGNTETTYSYEQGWFDHPISSVNFRERNRQNPTNQWPFRTDTLTAQNVSIGNKFKLNQSQIAKLGSNDIEYQWEDYGKHAIEKTASTMKQFGFTELIFRGNYFESSTQTNQAALHVGKYRIKFHSNSCGPTTIIAQQVQDHEQVYTFRKWNPEKKRVPYGASTDAEADSTYGNPICCYICMCVNCLMNTMFEEVVDAAVDGTISSEQHFKAQEGFIGTATSIMRPAGIILCILGFYMLFSPVIALLDMIPFVGFLLSGIVAIAAGIFALVVGLTLSTLTIAIAWVFFRPLIGVPLLAAVAASTYMIFVYDWGTPSVSGEVTTPAVAAST